METLRPYLKIEINNVTSRIHYDPNLYCSYFQDCMLAIDNKLAFFKKDYQLSPAYNSFEPDGTRKWDGKVHLFNPWTTGKKYGFLPFEFYTGNLLDVLNVIYHWGYRVEPYDVRNKPNLNELKLDWNLKYKLYPYQENIIKDSFSAGRGIVKTATASGKCLNENSLCLTENGIISFKEMAQDLEDQQYKDCLIKVATPLANNNKDIATKIYCDGNSLSNSITTRCGFNEIGTDSHKIKILDNNGNIVWKHLKDIKIGDITVITKGQMLFGNDNTLTEEDAYWLGIIIGDGCVSIKNRIQITNPDKHIINFCSNYAASNGLKLHNKPHKKSNICRELFIYNKKYIQEQLQNKFGLDLVKSIKKSIPLTLRKSPKNIIAAFIRGLFETDGWIENNKGIAIAFSSKILIDQLHIILLNFGIVACRRKKTTTHEDSHILTIYREYLDIFIKHIGLDPNCYKLKKLVNTINNLSKIESNTNYYTIPNQSLRIANIKKNIKEKFNNKCWLFFLKNKINRSTVNLWIQGYRTPSRKNLFKFNQIAKEVIGETNETRYLDSILEEQFFYDPVKEISKIESRNYDFYIPETHSFISQGFINHNTIIAANLIKQLGVKDVAFFVTTKDLMTQAKERFEDAFGIEIGIVGDGNCNIKDITIYTIQTAVIAIGKEKEFKEELKSLHNSEKNLEPEKYDEIRQALKKSKLIIYDEMHHVPANTCRAVLEYADNAYYRYAFGATVKREDGLDELIESLFGNFICNISPSYLIKEGFLVAPKIFMVPIGNKNTSAGYLGECSTYKIEYDTYIINNELRNNIISDIAKKVISEGLPTLILVKEIEHGEKLKQLISSGDNSYKDVIFLHGKYSRKKRKEYIDKMLNKELLCIISTSLADEGLDIVNLECLILAGGGKSETKALQRIGRVIRRDKSNPNKQALVYDFIDIWGDCLYKNSLERMKIYKTESEFLIYDLRRKNPLVNLKKVI